MDSIVALDIEFTGMDPDKDAIIEIGAVRFNSRRIESEWTTLINPGRPIPPAAYKVTGISDQMVREAPPIRAVIHTLKEYIGEAPILGHSVHFDLAFLRRFGILPLNDVLDTYELASVLMPTAGRYNLDALAKALGIPLSANHRALADAHATRAIFLRLIEMAAQLPVPLLAEIVQLGEPLDWGGYAPFREALRARSKEIISARQVEDTMLGPLFGEEMRRSPTALQPRQELLPLDEEEVAALVDYGGIFSRQFPMYEHRPQQVEMLRSVTRALSDGLQLLVEAGTGTGKSMAYLIPAALFAVQNGTRVVISTNTINLQDQLINKDIPDLSSALGINLRAAVLKGRSNYLCPRRFENLRKRGPENNDEMRVLAKVLVWLQNSHSGDRVELNLNGPAERDVWQRICAEDEGCTTENCIRRTGGICPFHRSHLAAQNAHLLIVNHALLLADISTDNRVLPEYKHLIIDEAHHLEEATTNALSFEATQSDVEYLLHELGGPRNGILGWALSAVENSLSPSDFAAVDQLVQAATDYAFNFEILERQFFNTIDQFMLELREGRPPGPYAYQERILPATRTQPGWGSIELCWDEAQRSLKSLLENLKKLYETVANLADSLAEENEELFSSLGNIYRRLLEVCENFNALVFDPSPERIYWIEANQSWKRISLHAAPLHVGPLMEKHLWSQKSSVILTSATLTTAGEFDYLRGRLFAENADELALGSPFDYETAALLYMVNDIPEPSDRHGHQHGVESGLIQLAQATGGRTLALFTSYDQLRRTSQAIRPALARFDIHVYEQGEGASPHTLLENFRSADRAVLLGTRAFWEGVDVPGEALSVLAIVKLPFDVPTDPIIAARAETFEDPFNQYQLPEAILRFRQGFGRLIRTQSDRGVVAVLDRRILTKRYGQVFIDSLPPCTKKSGPLSLLPRTAAQWLNI